MLLSTFDILEGHIVETVLEDRGGAGASFGDRGCAGASFGDRFGTEILGYTGDTLTMESAPHSSGRRVWKRVSRYEPHEPSGWVRADADRVQLLQDEFGESPFPLGATSLAFDADGVWHLDKLTETPCTGLALAVDDDVHHLQTEVDGRLEYIRWDGDELLRELPSVPGNGREPWDEFGGDEPRIRLGPEGQVALVVGKGRAVIRPADADQHRQTTTVNLTLEGEGTVELHPVGGAPVTCASSCTIEAPVGLYLPYKSVAQSTSASAR